MKVITEERLLGLRDNLYGYQKDWELVESLIDECQELDTLTVANEHDLILAAEKYAGNYDGDERQDIKTEVINAFYQGAYWNSRRNHEPRK